MAKRSGSRLPPVRTETVQEWREIGNQYDECGPGGISCESYEVKLPLPDGSTGVAESKTLLHRGAEGDLRGVLNYFPDGFPGIEEPGNFLVVVRPDCRGQGIGTALVSEADRQWNLNFLQQTYSADGRALVSTYLRRKGRA